METIGIEIPESLSNYIEGLHYEVNARRDIIALLIRQGDTGDAFQKYHKEYLEYYAKLETAKDTMANEYVKPKYPNCDWRLDFSANTVYVQPNKNATSQEV